MIDRARESRNPKKVIRVTLMESYGEIGRVPVNLLQMECFLEVQSVKILQKSPRNPEVSHIKPLFVVFP